jgi:hypothetical protein
MLGMWRARNGWLTQDKGTDMTETEKPEFNPCATPQDKIQERCLRCLHTRNMHDKEGCVLCFLRGKIAYQAGDLHAPAHTS